MRTAADDVMKGMEDAAKVAKEEFKELPKEAAEALRAWWKRHYLTAGHKRLARILMEDK